MTSILGFLIFKLLLASEVFRQTELLERGLHVPQETRGFDEAKAETFKLRSKEDAPDYRYMPDPNLPPLLVSEVLDFSFAQFYLISYNGHASMNAGIY